ncbi:hypothetical protein [Actinocrispum sp. NPDC049592]|uniref:hypothetical protein n=1 Tax=Actinocrispum sp. NPDC049592 TaxID=3154835 RepID=UPI0034448245
MVLSGSVASATMGVAMDMQDRIMDRFRSMPISRSSVLVGRTVPEILRTVVSLVVMVVVGTIIGFRFLGGLLPAIGGGRARVAVPLTPVEPQDGTTDHDLIG